MKLSWACGLGFAVFVGLSVSAARADLIYVTNAGTGTIGEYTTAGAPVNPALISGLSNPSGIAVSGANLWVASSGGGTIAVTAAPNGSYNGGAMPDDDESGLFFRSEAREAA
jgi:hypothetical protein